ncbi:MAG TPA: hypothetical protein VIV60_28595 [Polyangiaceae bacterium]
MRHCIFPLGAFLLAARVMLGCSPAQCRMNDPDWVLREYAAALRRGDAERAWSLLSEETKRSTTFDAFREELRRNPAMMRLLADRMERPIGPPTLTAQVGTPDSEPIEMMRIDGQWRLKLSSLDPFSQATPLAALRSFVRAVKLRRYDVLLRLAPERDRQQLSKAQLRQAFEGAEREELFAFCQAIEVNLGRGELEINGDHATFDLGEGSTAELLLERGVWCIENYRP